MQRHLQYRSPPCGLQEQYSANSVQLIQLVEKFFPTPVALLLPGSPAPCLVAVLGKSISLGG